jgi:glycosyltransferase involved in cell wall biosynthesis
MNAPEPRALIVLPTGIKGGAESVAFSLARDLAARRWRVLLYVMSRGWQPELRKLAAVPGIEIVTREFRSEKASVVFVIADLIRISRCSPFDLAYSTHLHVNAMLGLMRKLGLIAVKRLVARESTQIFERFRGPRRWLFRLMYLVGYGSQDLLILQTQQMLASLRTALRRMPVARFEVVPNPVDVAYLDANLQGAGCHAPGGKRIVACGRFVAIKGFERLIKAFGAIRHQFPDYQLELIGSGPLEGWLRQVAEEAGSKRVVFHGAMENPFPVLLEADIGVISSEREGFPNVLLEMMACSVRRIVCTPCTRAISSIPGLFVTAGPSVDELREGLRLALASDADKSCEYKAFLEENHSIEVFTNKVLGHGFPP